MTPFQLLKASSASELERLRHLMPNDLGTWRSKRLQRAAGTSGYVRTLLDERVAASHATRLAARYNARLAGLTQAETLRRLRFLTVLASVVSLVPHDIQEAVGQLEDGLALRFNSAKDQGAWALGAIEVEVVNLDLLRSVESQSELEKRKLSVVEALLAEGAVPFAGRASFALVHTHALVDLGPSADPESLERDLRRDLTATWPIGWTVELKRTFKDQPLSKKLTSIAAYLTKGGNEDLRFKAGFGRELASDLDAIMWRAGTGRKDRGGESLSDERGLTVGELKVLYETYSWLMNRNGSDDGYLIGFG